MADDDRWARGAARFEEINGMPAPVRGADPLADVVVEQVFAEIWTRPGLSRQERRWIAITCACMAGAPVAMHAHIDAALRTGDLSVEQLQEFVIQFAVYAGYPKATAARAVLEAERAKLPARE